jgi:hypothetical protein
MKNSYWIASAEGVYALVEGADQRDSWTRVRGWREASEPGPNDQVHIVHPEIGQSANTLPYAALEGAWQAQGWKPGPPPEPADLTKDPALADQPAEPVAAAPEKTTTAPAAGGTSKEK